MMCVGVCVCLIVFVLLIDEICDDECRDVGAFRVVGVVVFVARGFI